MKFLKASWRNITIIVLMLALISGIGVPALADVIRIQAQSSLDDLADVNATTPVDNDVLTWDTSLSEWVNAAQAAAGANQTGRSVTYTVAASDAPDIVKAQADYVCTGSDDQNTIQSALDALPATGGEIRLSSGTFHCEVPIDLDSNQTLRGCGKNTILTTSTLAEFNILTATGTSGSEMVGIVISDLQIDGADKASICIQFMYVDNSCIQNVWARNTSYDTGGLGIELIHCDSNRIVNNLVERNPYFGIEIQGTSTGNVVADNVCSENADGIAIFASDNAITGNTCLRNSDFGIVLAYGASGNTIIGNVCSDSGLVQYSQSLQGWGIALWTSSNYNVIIGNVCRGNARDGIRLDDSHYNMVEGNICVENSQEVTNTYSDICLNSADYNNIQGNTCRAGSLTNKPRYGININSADCDGNKIINNDLYDDGFGTGTYNDDGTDTIYIEPSDTADAIAKAHDRLHSLTSVSDHSDVNITSPANNDVIYWDNATGKWKSKAIVGGGDMLKSTYDTNNDGIVDTSEALAALATKNPPVDNDTVVQRDSTNSDSLFTSTWTQIKAFLKSFFDGIYAPLADFLGLNTTVAALNTTVAGHTIDIGDLQGNVSALQGDVSNLQGNMTIAQGNITTLAGNLSVIQGNITTISGDVTALNTTVTNNSGNITGLKSIAIIYVIDGGGSAITTGQKGHLDIPFDCTVTSWTIVSDVSGATQVDVWKDTYANFPPTDADSMCSGKEIKIVATNQKGQDLDISDWTTTTITAGDILAFNVDSCTDITRVTLTITATRVI